MKSLHRSSHGMTLVEVMVAGVIGLVPATIIIVLYSMYSNQLRENNARLALQRQYETVAQEVARHARRAHRIRRSRICFEPCNDTADFTQAIFFFEECPDTGFAGLMIRNDTLLELREGNTVPFTAGSPVLVDSDSSFLLPGCGNRITLRLRLMTIVHDTTYYLQPPESVFRCRN
jgi:type II secretory pathway pseudopilin PulG